VGAAEPVLVKGPFSMRQSLSEGRGRIFGLLFSIWSSPVQMRVFPKFALPRSSGRKPDVPRRATESNAINVWADNYIKIGL